jgi:hypothetical protein
VLRAAVRTAALLTAGAAWLAPPTARAQTPDELVAATNAPCRNDLPIYGTISYANVCTGTCNGLPATLPGGALNSQWLQCEKAKSDCVTRVDEENAKIAKYNEFARACRAKFSAIDQEREKHVGVLADRPDKQGSGDDVQSAGPKGADKRSQGDDEADDAVLHRLNAAEKGATEDASDADRQNKNDLDQLAQERDKYREDAQKRAEDEQKRMDDALAARRAAEQEQREIEEDYARQRAAERQQSRSSQQSSSGAPPNCRWPARYAKCMAGNYVCDSDATPENFHRCCLWRGCGIGQPRFGN